MAGSQISTSVNIINSLLGFQAVSLTNFTTSAESVIAAGSKVEIASAFFTFGSDTQPGATSWTAITTANTAYITCLPTGTAGSQLLTVDYSDTAPTWSDSKQGWYASAGSTIRYVGGVIKSGASSYEFAFILSDKQDHGMASVIVEKAGDRFVRMKVFEIGEWDMDNNTSSTLIPHGITNGHDKIRACSAQIYLDTKQATYDLTHNGGGGVVISDDDLSPQRELNGFFDDTIFNATASTVLNRGWVTIWYEDDDD